MKESTRKEYLSLAKHFMTKVEQDKGSRATPSDYIAALKERAYKTTPAYWRRLKTALAVYCEDNSYHKYAKQYREMVNPISDIKRSDLPKNIREATAKRNKVKQISPEDLNKISLVVTDRGDVELLSAIHIITECGCRPSELNNMSIDGNKITIVSTKKTGNRGLDRIININDDAENLLLFKAALDTIQYGINKSNIAPERYLKRIQDRFANAARTALPKQKQPCLYTLRHQMGSNLKGLVADGKMSRKEAAYILGHQSTESIDKYGDIRWAQGSGSPKGVGDISLVREKHIELNNQTRDRVMEKVAKIEAVAEKAAARSVDNESSLDYGM